MRVTSDLWVSAIVRRVFNAGDFAAVARRGATEAGSIFLVFRDRSGAMRLYGPAPQASYDDARPSERAFVEIASVDDEAAIQARLDREMRFDPDLWIVEIDSAALAPGDILTLTTP